MSTTLAPSPARVVEMTAEQPAPPVPDRLLGEVEVVVPVYNEQADLGPSVTRLRDYLDRRFPFPTVVTVVDNASTDGTWAVAADLARRLPGVRALRLADKGRGRALRAAWSASEADVVAYMDVDLSTDLDALLPLVAPLLSGHSDVAIGTRLARGSRVVRGPKRELISRAYNLLVHAVLGNGFSDAQCGFKALRADAARRLLPLVADEQWFFDTELLVQAERLGLRIHEVPVDWVDDPDSRVDLVATAWADLRGVARLLRQPAPDPGPGLRGRHPSELARFAGVGLLSTLAYLVLFLVLRPVLGPLGANAAALAVTTGLNAVAHRRRSPQAPHRPARGPGLFATSLLFTTCALGLAALVAPGSVVVELVALLGATAGAALVRFVLLRAWIFRTAGRRPR
jgi:putative flippase GtrA